MVCGAPALDRVVPSGDRLGAFDPGSTGDDAVTELQKLVNTARVVPARDCPALLGDLRNAGLVWPEVDVGRQALPFTPRRWLQLASTGEQVRAGPDDKPGISGERAVRRTLPLMRGLDSLIQAGQRDVNQLLLGAASEVDATLNEALLQILELASVAPGCGLGRLLGVDDSIDHLVHYLLNHNPVPIRDRPVHGHREAVFVQLLVIALD